MCQIKIIFRNFISVRQEKKMKSKTKQRKKRNLIQNHKSLFDIIVHTIK